MRKQFIFGICGLLLFGAGCGSNGKNISASGTIEIREVDLASRISSRVEELYADEGKSVKKGEVLARLDERIVRAQKETAEAFHAQSKANFERSRRLFDSKSITREQFDAAQAGFIKAESDLKQARIMFDESKILAPWDGIVIKKNVETGELVSPNTPLFTLGDLSRARVIIYVSLVELGKVKLGQRAEVAVDSFRDKVFKGSVTRISGKAEFTPKNVQTKDERIKEVFEVEITVPNPGMELKPGMPADVEILTAQSLDYTD
ncbi:MAG: efflux RND transporter periplasmic adaptor subunit [Endomicrobiales bacterium]|nr:efflux RND transporter periplasmic adaptor subunit [Endomicrobiales bacterium]